MSRYDHSKGDFVNCARSQRMKATTIEDQLAQFAPAKSKSYLQQDALSQEKAQKQGSATFRRQKVRDPSTWI
ncbi:unnamed protein product [Acidithrix sp. C25]|nr:unnamed protein product [Acidithrix sp. C25]